jgi:hypothetical protein
VRCSALGARRSALLGIVLLAGAAGAQQSPRAYGELRVEGIFGTKTAGEVGGGIVLPLGPYVRTGITAQGGLESGSASAKFSGRLDLMTRYLLDPYRENQWGFSIGGGVTVPYAEHPRDVRPRLTVVMDLEGRRRGRFSPAIQAGLGGGARVAVVLRTSTGRWR